MQIALTSKLIVSNCQGPWEHITNYTYTETYFSPLKCAFDLLQQKWIAWTAQFPWVQLTTKGNEAWYTMIYWRHTTLLSDQMTHRSMCSLQTISPSNTSPPTSVLHKAGLRHKRLLAPHMRAGQLTEVLVLIDVSNSHWPKQLFPHASKLPPPCQNTTVERAYDNMSSYN